MKILETRSGFVLDEKGQEVPVTVLLIEDSEGNQIWINEKSHMLDVYRLEEKVTGKFKKRG